MASVTMALCMALVALAYGQSDMTRPTIVSVSPSNNELNVDANEPVTVVFSEDMDPATLNENTFTVMRRTTPESGDFRSMEIEKTITSNGRTATFTPDYDFSTGQMYGNVFTVLITTDVKDLAGNSLARDYFWSFSTGGDAFNEGVTTAQLSQTPLPGDTVPVTTNPVVAVPAAATTTFPWVWILGGILVLVLVALLTMLLNPKQEIQEGYPEGFVFGGDVHPVIDLEGIGPEYSKGLNAIGIKNTQQLWEADAADIASKTGFPLASIKSWQHMAELSSVKDIGPQYAELLERSGVHSVSQLRKYTPNKLLRLVRAKQNSLKVRIQGSPLGLALVSHWITEARDHKFSAVAQ